MSILFFLIATALTAGVTALMVRPLLRQSSRADAQEDDRRLSVYRQHMNELEQERSSGSLTQEQYQESRQELERRLLDETRHSAVPGDLSRWNVSSKTLALALIVALPASGFGLYWALGNPMAIVDSDAQQARGGSSGYDHQTASGLDALAERLMQRLAQNPTDGPGWALLARSYVELGRHADAASAFEKAAALLPDDAQLLVDFADALAMANARRLDGKPEELIARALKLEPRNVKGLMLAGTIAYDRKQFRAALQQWEQAQRLLPADTPPELNQELAENISEIRRRLGLAAASDTTSKQAVGPAPSAVSAGTAITGTITLAPTLAGKGSPSDALFVFARAVEGPPMPVAIVRATRQDLPFTFRLDDSNSPMPARKLSQAGPVVIVARISKSGDAMPRSGDLQGMSRAVKPGDQDVRVAIESELP